MAARHCTFNEFSSVDFVDQLMHVHSSIHFPV